MTEDISLTHLTTLLMRPDRILAIVVTFILCSAFIVGIWMTSINRVSPGQGFPPGLFGPESHGVLPASVASPYVADFFQEQTLQETGSMGESNNAYWWLNSGGKMMMRQGVIRSIQGDLLATDQWRTLYASSNGEDTDNGFHPQNLLRLLTRSKWRIFREQAYFRINAYHLSNSTNRSESNGLLLFSRYVDSDNLYYAGVRVDGAVVIKKKQKGAYTTLAYEPFFAGTYDRTSRPNLIPLNSWIGLRLETTTNTDGTTSLRLYADTKANGSWMLVLEAKDDGKNTGPAITSSGYAGIRTDFMDEQISDYRAKSL